MRARRSAYERAGDGFELAPVAQARLQATLQAENTWLGAAGSAVIHAGLIASLLVLSHGAPPGEAETAPAFAVEYEAAAPDTPSPPSVSEPRVSLGESDAPPPPPEQPHADDAVQLPPIRYGGARHAPANNNPFARLVPFDLANNQHHSHLAGRPGATLDFSGAPVERQGRLTDTITHPAGSQVSGDYDAKLVAWVESHRDDIQAMLKDADPGSVTLAVTIARDGHVLRLHLLRPSGSALLDAAWVSFYRDFTPPPFAGDIVGNEYTFNYTLEYSVYYGSSPR